MCYGFGESDFLFLTTVKVELSHIKQITWNPSKPGEKTQPDPNEEGQCNCHLPSSLSASGSWLLECSYVLSVLPYEPCMTSE